MKKLFQHTSNKETQPLLKKATTSTKDKSSSVTPTNSESPRFIPVATLPDYPKLMPATEALMITNENRKQQQQQIEAELVECLNEVIRSLTATGFRISRESDKINKIMTKALHTDCYEEVLRTVQDCGYNGYLVYCAKDGSTIGDRKFVEFCVRWGKPRSAQFPLTSNDQPIYVAVFGGCQAKGEHPHVTDLQPSNEPPSVQPTVQPSNQPV